MSDSEAQHDYLLAVLRRTGWNQTELAARAGLDPSTLSRFLRGGGGLRAMRGSTIRKIEQVSGLAFGVDPARPAEPQHEGFSETEAEPLDAAADTQVGQLVLALRGRYANVDPWVMRGRGLESAGYRPGDILFVALGETPLAGDVVCAQLYDWAAGRAETVFRIFQPPYLVAASGDAGLMRPHVVDDARVQVKGVVVSTLRQRLSG